MKEFAEKLEKQDIKTKVMFLIGIAVIVALLGYLIGYMII